MMKLYVCAPLLYKNTLSTLHTETMKDTQEYYIEYLRRKWYIKADKSKMAALIECDPTALKARPWSHRIPRVFRFTKSTSDIFQQYDPVVVLRGSSDALLALEAQARVRREGERNAAVDRSPCANQGCRLCPADLGHDKLADCCIALTYEQLTDLIEHCKRKRYSEAYDLMQFPDSAHRGQRIVVHKYLTMTRAHWLKGGHHMLVCVQFHQDEIQLNPIHGMRDPGLTTPENVERGGEDVKEAAVRVAREQGFEIQEAELIHIEGQRKAFQRRDCLEFFRIEVK
jgi:hypothetical protein